MSADEVAVLHAEVEREARRLHVLHAERLACARGCTSCCQDELTVFPVEADLIRSRYDELLATAAPHAAGACAFLDDAGACRVYDARPYVCRTQGLPLRWFDEDEAGPVELRDICPLNDAGAPLESLPEDECWTLGPAEERLATLQVHADADAPRVSLRSLFRR
ncbi:MAG: YkgJ family cysteine cluster protein [Polyangia bacterium]